MNHNENCWEMFVEYKATQGLLKNFNNFFFNSCIHEYQTLFQSPHLRDFKNPNDDVYHAPPYKKNSPCEDREFNKELNNEKVMERIHSFLQFVI
jgi:hypothetical protein